MLVAQAGGHAAQNVNIANDPVIAHALWVIPLIIV